MLRRHEVLPEERRSEVKKITITDVLKLVLMLLFGGNAFAVGVILMLKALHSNRLADSVDNDPLILWMAASQASLSMMMGMLIIMFGVVVWRERD